MVVIVQSKQSQLVTVALARHRLPQPQEVVITCTHGLKELHSKVYMVASSHSYKQFQSQNVTHLVVVAATS